MTQATTWGVPRVGPATPTAYAERADDSLDALLSCHRGASRPSYAVAGTLWIKEVSATVEEVYFFDGSNDLLWATINPTAGTIVYAGSAVPIARGGHGQTTAPAARTALGLEINTDVQGYFGPVDTTTTPPTNGDGLVFNGTDWVPRPTRTVSPAQITADQDNFAPTDWQTATLVRLDTDASRTITGFAAPSSGRAEDRVIVNVGSNDLVLAHEGASSTAATRVDLSGGADLTLTAGQSVTLRYDPTSSRWRDVAGRLGGGGQFTEEYISAEQTITSGGGLTLAHGLSAKPKIVLMHLVCKTAEHGYSIGDEVEKVIDHEYFAEGSSFDRGVSIVKDSTSVTIRYGSHSTVFLVINKSTGAAAEATNSRWRVVLRAYA